MRVYCEIWASWVTDGKHSNDLCTVDVPADELKSYFTVYSMRHHSNAFDMITVISSDLSVETDDAQDDANCNWRGWSTFVPRPQERQWHSPEESLRTRLGFICRGRDWNLKETLFGLPHIGSSYSLIEWTAWNWYWLSDSFKYTPNEHRRTDEMKQTDPGIYRPCSVATRGCHRLI